MPGSKNAYVQAVPEPIDPKEFVPAPKPEEQIEEKEDQEEEESPEVDEEELLPNEGLIHPDKDSVDPVPKEKPQDVKKPEKAQNWVNLIPISGILLAGPILLCIINQVRSK